MAFTPIIWQDLPTQTTPLTSANLNKLVQTGIITDEYDSTATYAVGAYCIYNNTLYKCTTAITTAEGWDSIHWAAVQISTELRGKLDKTIIVTETGTSCNDYMDDGIYWFGTAETRPTDSPESGTYGWMQVLSSGGSNIKQIWHRSSSINGNTEFRTFVRLYNVNTQVWSNWKQYQMGGDTGWLDLSLSSGITQYANNDQYKCQYRKVGDIVYVVGCVKGISANNTTIASMPAGYRPINTYRYMTGRNTTGNSIISIATNGTISFVGLSEGATIASTDYVYIQTSFFVA